MGLIYVLEPEASTNLAKNPSAELATTGWTAVAGSLALSQTFARFGINSVAVTPAAGTSDGAYYLTDANLTSGATYTASVYVKGVNGVPMQFYFATTAGAVKGTPYTWTADGNWKRVKVTWAADATAQFRLYVAKNNNASTAVFYVDGLQYEALDHATTYIDGDQPGGKWNGSSHSSTSYRLANTRLGGRIRDLSDFGLYLDSSLGFGGPPVANQLTPYARIKGALWSYSKLNARVITLGGVIVGTTLADFWSKRASIWNDIRPDSTLGLVQLRYTGTGTTLQIGALYDGGFEGGKTNGFSEQVAIRFVCPDPDLIGVSGGE
jgi:hypothetical protein